MREAIALLVMFGGLIGYALWERAQWRLELRRRAIRRAARGLSALSDAYRRFGMSLEEASLAIGERLLPAMKAAGLGFKEAATAMGRVLGR